MESSHVMIMNSTENNVHDFIEFFQKDVPSYELKSFIIFLRLINIYDVFFNKININKLKNYINVHPKDYIYYRIIPYALDDIDMEEFEFWNVIDIMNDLRCKVLYGISYYENKWNNKVIIRVTKNYIDSVEYFLEHQKKYLDKKTYNILNKYIKAIEANI